VSDQVQVPWLVKHIRHGSLRMKRFKAHASLALLGVWLFIDSLVGKALEFFYHAEGHAYRHWVFSYADGLGLPPAPKKPVVAPVLSLIDFGWDILGVFGVLWTVVWIYCDAYCLAAEKCSREANSSLADHISKYLARALLRAASIAAVTYLMLWSVFIWSGLHGFTNRLLSQWAQVPQPPVSTAAVKGVADSARLAVENASLLTHLPFPFSMIQSPIGSSPTLSLLPCIAILAVLFMWLVSDGSPAPKDTQ